MRIEFSNNRLARAYAEPERAIRQWGDQIGIRYVQRVRMVENADRWEDLQSFRALRIHPLRGSRRDQWAVNVTGRWRLIVTRPDQDTVRIEEVSAHYGD